MPLDRHIEIRETRVIPIRKGLVQLPYATKCLRGFNLDRTPLELPTFPLAPEQRRRSSLHHVTLALKLERPFLPDDDPAHRAGSLVGRVEVGKADGRAAFQAAVKG